MNLLNIPLLVIENHLFPLLALNDVLRFRRTCKYAKFVADDYLRLFGKELLGEISINGAQAGKSFEDFMDIGFSLSKVNLKVDEPEVLGSKGALEFRKNHGSSIKELTVDNMYCCIDPAELQFYEALTELESLEIETVHIITACRFECNYPDNLCENLKKLKINEVHIPDGDWSDRPDYVFELYDRCDIVEYLKHPLYRHAETGSVIMNISLINFVAHMIYASLVEEFQNLKVYDLSSFRYEWKRHQEVNYFVKDLMPTVTDLGFKLLGVDTNFLAELQNNDDLDERHYDNLDELNMLGRCLLSITNVNGIMFAIQDAPFIEEIDINSTAKCSLVGYDVAMDANRWPNLKRLSMCVDSRRLERGEPITDLYDHLFGANHTHHQLTQLTIVFERVFSMDVGPSVAAIVSSCPNVKKLELKKWPGTNKALSNLLAGLHNLEQVCFDNCLKLGNLAFVGEDKGNPVFLGLHNLKRFELRNLEKMPKITDTIFSLVFRHMKLTHFIIRSDEPITKVTQAGIRALLSGEFAQSIVKFPFQGWSLADVPEESFKELAAEFRSSFMI